VLPKGGLGVFEDEDTRIYVVVVNEEEQYSIWPADREPPAGWRPAGTTGSKSECLSRIEQIWPDMRPLSLREWMAEQERSTDG
jgi:MbtH protein